MLAMIRFAAPCSLAMLAACGTTTDENASQIANETTVYASNTSSEMLHAPAAAGGSGLAGSQAGGMSQDQAADGTGQTEGSDTSSSATGGRAAGSTGGSSTGSSGGSGD